MKNTFFKHTFALIIAFCTTSALAQTHETWEFPDDVKNYSVVRANTGSNITTPTNECMYGGTIFRNVGSNCAGDGSMNIIETDANNSLLYSFEYDHPDYDDERVVSIVADNPGDNATVTMYYTVSMVRPANTYAINDRTMIKIVRIDDQGTATSNVDNNGNQVPREMTIYVNTGLGSPTNNYNLYPTHAIYSQALSGRNLLYICGYYVPGNSRASQYDQPDFSDTKSAFIISIDVDPNSAGFWKIHGSYFWDESPNLATLTTVDYDMALRMTENNGNIWVTGMTNALTQSAMGVPYTFRSGTMNIVFNPDLTVMNPVIQNHPFINLGNGDGAGMMEYGNAFYDDGNAKFIAGNFHESSDYFGCGYQAYPYWFHITRLDNYPNYDWTTGTGLRVIPGGTPPVVNPPYQSNSNARVSTMLPSDIANGPNQSSFLLTGIVDGYSNCYSTPGYLRCPFIYDVQVDYGGPMTITSLANPYNVSNYFTYAGTGGSNANGLDMLGGTLSSTAWLPVMFNRTGTGSTSNVLFSGPRYINSKQGLKLFMGDASTSSPQFQVSCASPDNSCPLDNTGQVIEDPNVTLVPVSVPLAETYDNGSNPLPYMSQYFTSSYEACGTQFKHSSTSVKAAPKKRNVKIFPNPAKDEINMTLSGDIADDASVKILLVNIQGQLVGTLYNGYAKNAPTKLHIPDVASGVYMVKVYANDLIMHTEKLTIQK